jgi:hypothetical protein
MVALPFGSVQTPRRPPRIVGQGRKGRLDHAADSVHARLGVSMKSSSGLGHSQQAQLGSDTSTWTRSVVHRGHSPFTSQPTPSAAF